jgi:uncharacterized protein YceK
MKQHILVTAVAAAVMIMSGCSSTRSTQIAPGPSATTAISEQRLATSEFKRQGVRITYTLSGELDSIEATGYAPVWGNSQNAAREAFRVAELEAKKSLNDFINKESIKSTTSVRTISQNLERAQDNKTNNFASNRSGDADRLVALDEEVDKSANNETTREENTAVRRDALNIASRLDTSITTQNRGILGGLYLVEGRVINDGKTVQAVYRWDRKSNATRAQLRNLMAQ